MRERGLNLEQNGNLGTFDRRSPCGERGLETQMRYLQRRVLREAAANPDEQSVLRSLLKEIRALLDADEDEEDLDDEDEKEIALALRCMVLELKGERR
jgi:hypothetical protein